MDPADLEGTAIATYQRHRLDPEEPEATFKLARLELGAPVTRADLVGKAAKLFWHDGLQRIAVRRSLPLAYALFFTGHELAHVLLERAGYAGEDLEAACDYLGAALIAPRPAVRRLYRTFGLDLAEIADATRSTQTWAGLRVGEVQGMPIAADSPLHVRVRGPEAWAWPDAGTIRGWARKGGPGLRKVPITDGRGRLALVAEGE